MVMINGTLDSVVNTGSHAIHNIHMHNCTYLDTHIIENTLDGQSGGGSPNNVNHYRIITGKTNVTTAITTM